MIYSQSSFSDGYKAGFKKGYCLENIGCVAPIPPIAPIPAAGFSTYSDGYARGVQDGQRKRQSNDTSSSSGAYQNPTIPSNVVTPAKSFNDSFQESFNRSFNQTQQLMQSMYANLDKRGSATYFPKPNKNIKPFKKLEVSLSKGFGSLNIALDDSGGEDKMFLGQKLFLGLKGKNILVSPFSPYRVSFQYNFRPDTGCGGVVINKLQMFITDTRNNDRIASVSFRQGSFEGKCIDDVIFQTIDRLLKMKSRFTLGEYENFINVPKELNEVQKNEEDIYSELKKLKELLDLEIITREEYEKKSNELKKIILN